MGSTRIKAVLTDENANVLAQGGYEWENTLVDGLWSYSLNEAWEGLQKSYAALNEAYKLKTGAYICDLTAIGISAMMHGYLAFDANGNQLAPFITWRNTNAARAAEKLSALFGFNVPMRWSVSQYYQHCLNGSPHLKDVAFLTTLAGYIHYKLTGKKVLGIGDASGMFPVSDGDYDPSMLKKFNELVGFDFKTVLPKVLLAGQSAGELTDEGARLLDPSGNLRAGVSLCPPEGDMGTGMICTNAVAPRTANISSGTSANLTVVLEKPLKKYYRQIDVIATPAGDPAALIHANNCTSEINEWVSLFGEVAELTGATISRPALFEKLFKKSLESDENSGVTVYNFLAGEPLADAEKGAPMVFRTQGGKLNLANFMQAQIYSAVATISLGMDILRGEDVKVDSVTAHGGFYKTEFVGQNATSALVGAPVTVIENAGEGGAWGIALLAIYLTDNKKPLGEFLNDIFKTEKKTTVMASDAERLKFGNFISAYKKGLSAELAASKI